MRTAITGGIGSGKSYVCRMLREWGISVYDCDAHAKRLMVEDEGLRRQLTELIGPDTYIRREDGGAEMTTAAPCSSATATRFALNKAVVARFLMSSAENAHALEHIVHPAVIGDFLNSGMEWVESAILFESGLHRYVDRVVVVVAPEEVRIARVMERDGISREKALEWINRQLPQQQLEGRADHIIVNDGQTPLRPQIEKLTTLCA